MPNLLVTTPDFLLRYDTQGRQTFIVEGRRGEYYGVSWFPGTQDIVLAHSGLDNDQTRTIHEYMTSEVGYLSHGERRSWPLLSHPHQILCLEEGLILVTNTGRNCLTIVHPNDFSIRHFWPNPITWDRFSEAERIGNHFNSIYFQENTVYLLAHNFDRGSFTIKLSWPDLKPLATWHHQSTAMHNLWPRDQDLICCDSLQHSLVDLMTERTLWVCEDKEALIRGLAATGDKIYIGASQMAPRATRRHSLTEIWELEAGSFAPADLHSLGPFGAVHEIRLLDEPDLCHGNGALAITPYLEGQRPELYLAGAKMAIICPSGGAREPWIFVEGESVAGEDFVAAPPKHRVLALRPDYTATNLRVSGRLDLSAWHSETAALVLRYQGPGDQNMLALILNRGTGDASTLGLWRHHDDAWSCLAHHDVRGLTARVAVNAEDRQLTIDCEGVKVIEWQSDLPATSGGVGIRTSSGAVYDFNVTSLDH